MGLHHSTAFLGLAIVLAAAGGASAGSLLGSAGNLVGGLLEPVGDLLAPTGDAEKGLLAPVLAPVDDALDTTTSLLAASEPEAPSMQEGTKPAATAPREISGLVALPDLGTAVLPTDPQVLLPALTEPKPEGAGGDGGSPAPLPSAGSVSLPPAASAGQASPEPGAASGVGSQMVGADLEPRQGIGPAAAEWAGEALADEAGWLDGIPVEIRGAASAAALLLFTGLLTLGAYLMGFRHVGRDNLLEHTFRHQMLRLVREEPGIHLREVARRLGLTTTNAAYHLRMLEKHGFIQGVSQHGKRVYVPAEGTEAKRKHLAQALLQRDARADLVRALADSPGINQSNLAAQTRQHQGAVGWHLRRLAEAGLVHEERTPRECRYRLTALGRELARPVAPEAPVAAPVPQAATA